MPEIIIAGVTRAGEYSPNNIGNDAAIFHATVEQLQMRGCRVNIYSEWQFQETEITEGIVIDMCRERKSIDKLCALEDEGRLVINSGYGIENCTREKLTRLLLGTGVPCPESLIVNTDEDVKGDLSEAGFTSCWIKRGDFHATHKEDVSYCGNPEEAQRMLHEYYFRGIKRAVINRHLPGDLIKFYGVSGEPFFHWFYPFDEGHSKYGHEAVNGKPEGIGFDVEYLKEICRKASEVTGVKVYGGDCIVDCDGSIKIIDFNDWPSFAPCRAEAAPFIAKCIMKSIKVWKEG